MMGTGGAAGNNGPPNTRSTTSNAVIGFTSADRSKIDQVLRSLGTLNDSFKSLKDHVKQCHEIIISQHKEINTLRSESNLEVISK